MQSLDELFYFKCLIISSLLTARKMDAASNPREPSSLPPCQRVGYDNMWAGQNQVTVDKRWLDLKQTGEVFVF